MDKQPFEIHVNYFFLFYNFCVGVGQGGFFIWTFKQILNEPMFFACLDKELEYFARDG